ncbi:MAG TPA: PAS domain-containing protein, partial [Planctomycetota bacterium]|nr:PAS domain-containing protein [Planctomycetota bacterium]
MAVPSALTPSSDASYLRRLLERQPACLIRVRLDGVLLACNDAALSLFGVGALRAVLNTNLVDRMVPAQRTKWEEFTTRCWANGAASLECHLVILDDKARPVLVQGVALKDHPDGVESLLLHLRDQSQMHRLEHSIQSAEIDRVDNEERQRAARDQVEGAAAERLKLAVLADEDQAERRRLTEALEAQTADLQRRQATFVELERRVEESQLVLLQREREHRDRIAALNTALAAAHAAQLTTFAGPDKQELEAVTLHLQAATAEQARLEALVAEYEIDRKRITADHLAAVDTLEQSLAHAGKEAALGGEQSRQAMAELRSQLVQVLSEQSRMAARAEEHERERDFVRAEHHRALADLETSKDLAVAELRAQLAETAAEQGRLAARVEEHELARDRLIAEHHRAVGDVETSKHETLAELRSQLEQSSAEQGRLAARVEEHELARDRLIAEHHGALGDLETSKREALAESR